MVTLFPSLTVIVVFVMFLSTDSFFAFSAEYRFQNKPTKLVQNDAGALFLTPLIEKGDVRKAQKLAAVPPMLRNIHSFSGFLTVNKTTNSNMFFWLFKSQSKNWEERPLILFLTGGYGASSLLSVLAHNGPFSVTAGNKLKRRKYTWNKEYNVLYFDNPVGTGFSFTEDDKGYAKNHIDVARDLYAALLQILTLFPNLQKNKIFFAGDSCGGKYAISLAHKIYKLNGNSSFKIRIDGLFLMSPPVDFEKLLHYGSYGSYLYGLGLVDSKESQILDKKSDEILAEVHAGNYDLAELEFEKMLGSFLATTGLKNPINYLDDTSFRHPEFDFAKSTLVRTALHVANFTFNNKTAVYLHIRNDMYRSTRSWLEELLEAELFPILFCYGQLDIKSAYSLSLNVHNSLNWPRASEYLSAQRCKFKVNGKVAGYYKTAGTFTEVLMRNTGHEVVFSQPEWALELLQRFTNNLSYFESC